MPGLRRYAVDRTYVGVLLMEARPDPFASLQREGRLQSCGRDPQHKGKPYRVTMPDGRELMLCEQCAEKVPGKVQ